MSFQSPRVCLSVLVSLWALGVAPATAGNLVPISSRLGSGIAIDPRTLSPQLCGTPWLSPKPLVKCHLIVPNEVGTMLVDPSEGKVIDLHFTGAEPLPSTCGRWDILLTLDPTLPQPVSPFIFEERPDNPERGLFAAVLKMNTNLHLENRETGQTVDIPLLLGLGLAGPWTLASPTGSATEKQLLLLADREADRLIPYEDCVPAKVLNDPRFDVELNDCRICLESAVTPTSGGTQNPF